VAPKSTVTPVAKKATSSTSKPKGLQLSAAQWKAYNAAYTASASAAYRKQAIQSAAQSLRQARLSAAYSIAKKTAAAHAAARTAAIAAQAVAMSYRQSVLAHQNAALQARVYADFQKHVQAAARLQYVYKGEKAYAHEAVMRTLDTSQAVSVETARFAAAVKSAKAATASTAQVPTANAKAAASLASAAIQANAKAAAIAAARATPVGRTAPRPDAAVAGNWQEPPFCGAWRGDPFGSDCVAAAVANHLLYSRRCYLADPEYLTVMRAAGAAPELGQALERVSLRLLPDFPVRLASYEPVTGVLAGDIIGFATPKGPHAALYLGDGQIASWGEVIALGEVMLPETAVEEAWQITWTLS
jgi:hypothetical protein